ncbi:MAG: hypothetical protein MHM6MM_004190 [Cercozoa sp. M6MM]
MSLTQFFVPSHAALSKTLASILSRNFRLLNINPISMSQQVNRLPALHRFSGTATPRRFYVHTLVLPREGFDEYLGIFRWYFQPDSSDASKVSITSFNLLKRGFELPDEYPNLPAHCNEWAHRRPRLERLILRSNADVLCLQECDLPSFEEDFGEALSNAGYEFVLQRSKKSRNGHTMACAIAYKRDKFTHTWEDHRSRSLLLQLRFHRQEVEQEENVPACEEHVQNTEASAEHLENTVGTPEPLQEHESHQKRNKKKQRKKKRKVDPPRHPEDHLIVACCHLEGTPNAVAARVSQMHKSLHRIRLQQSEMGMTVESAPVIIAGDFNCAGRSAVAELLETGNLEPSFREHHYTVEPCKKEISHELELRDAWGSFTPPPLPSW